MKKIFTLVSVLLVIAFGAGQAIGGAVGTLDDVLAPDVFAPFFLVDTNLASPQENTLIAYQEMRGLAARFHGYLFTRDSVAEYTWVPEPLTAWDVNQWYVSDILKNIPETALKKYEVTVNGTKYYAGYIVLENETNPSTNHVGGWVYQVSLAAGKAACDKLPSREWALGAVNTNQGVLAGVTTPGTALAQREVLDFTAANAFLGGAINGPGAPFEFPITAAEAAAWFSDLEAFSPNAFAIAQERTFGIVLNAPSSAVDTWHLFPRYYLYDSTGSTYFVIWTNVANAALINHVNVFDENENVYDINVPLPNELNIINAADYISPLFITGSNDFGFFDFNWGTANNAINNTIRNQDWIVYSYQNATGPAAQSWNVLERGFCAVGT